MALSLTNQSDTRSGPQREVGHGEYGNCSFILGCASGSLNTTAPLSLSLLYTSPSQKTHYGKEGKQGQGSLGL